MSIAVTAHLGVLLSSNHGEEREGLYGLKQQSSTVASRPGLSQCGLIARYIFAARSQQLTAIEHGVALYKLRYSTIINRW